MVVNSKIYSNQPLHKQKRRKKKLANVMFWNFNPLLPPPISETFCSTSTPIHKSVIPIVKRSTIQMTRYCYACSTLGIPRIPKNMSAKDATSTKQVNSLKQMFTRATIAQLNKNKNKETPHAMLLAARMFPFGVFSAPLQYRISRKIKAFGSRSSGRSPLNPASTGRR